MHMGMNNTGHICQTHKKMLLVAPTEFSWSCIHTRVSMTLLLQGLSPHFSSTLKEK